MSRCCCCCEKNVGFHVVNDGVLYSSGCSSDCFPGFSYGFSEGSLGFKNFLGFLSCYLDLSNVFLGVSFL